MVNRRSLKLLNVLVAVTAVTWLARGTAADDQDRSDTVRNAVTSGAARDVILFIGDGMGDSEITAARNYAVGPGGRLALDTAPRCALPRKGRRPPTSSASSIRPTCFSC
jgi:alkaline phosphatase